MQAERSLILMSHRVDIHCFETLSLFLLVVAFFKLKFNCCAYFKNNMPGDIAEAEIIICIFCLDKTRALVHHFDNAFIVRAGCG